MYVTSDLSLFKYKLKLMRADRHIMHWIMLNWTSLNNTYCQTVYNSVEMFISAFLHPRTMASSVSELTELSLAIWWSLSVKHFFICLFFFGFSFLLYRAHFALRRCRLLKCYCKHLSWLLKCIVVFSRTALRFLWFLADTCSGLCLFGTLPSQAQAQPWVYFI